MSSKSYVVAVDFDGTIAKTRYPVIEEMYPEAQIYLRKWRRIGHKLILWTCREGKDLQAAVDFCMQHGVVFNAVNANDKSLMRQWNTDPRKIGYDYIIDDKCVLPIREQWRLLNEILGG